MSTMTTPRSPLTPEQKAKIAVYQRAYRTVPENKAKAVAYQRAYCAVPENKAKAAVRVRARHARLKQSKLAASKPAE
jgi:hypothetical protein